MNSGEDYIDKVLTELATSSYGNPDTEYFTKASNLLHDCIEEAIRQAQHRAVISQLKSLPNDDTQKTVDVDYIWYLIGYHEKQLAANPQKTKEDGNNE